MKADLRYSKPVPGGCLVRSTTAKGIGYTAHANLDAWPVSVAAVRHRNPDVRLVVPGHGEPGDAELLAHTRALIASHERPSGGNR